MLHERIPDLAKFVEPDRVRKEVYTDPQIFELEMERIHERVWIYCGHESQVPQAGRLLHGADRPPADADGARAGRRRARALQPLPASRVDDVRRSSRQHRRVLPLFLPLLDLPSRRQPAQHPHDGLGLRRHALGARQPRLPHATGGAHGELPRLRVREPGAGWTDAEGVPRRIPDRLRRHVRSCAGGQGRGGAQLLPRDPELELEDLPGEPARRAASVRDAPVHRPRRPRRGGGDREEDRQGAAVLSHAVGVRHGDHRQVGWLPDPELPERPLHSDRLHGAAPQGPRHARIRAGDGRRPTERSAPSRSWA